MVSTAVQENKRTQIKMAIKHLPVEITDIWFHHNWSLSKEDTEKQERKRSLVVWESMRGWKSHTKYVQDAFSTRSAPQITSHSQMVLPYWSKPAEIWGNKCAPSSLCASQKSHRLSHRGNKTSAEVVDEGVAMMPVDPGNSDSLCTENQ